MSPHDSVAVIAPGPTMPVNRDNAFWLEGARAGVLLIQRCDSCETLRHPPGPMCPRCHAMDWTAVPASGKGVIYSYTIHHKPPIAGFEAPFAVVLIELVEGVRMIGGLVAVDIQTVRIGLPVEVQFGDPQTGALPMWRLAEGVA